MTDSELGRWLSATLEEYKALRAEMLAFLDKQYILAYWAISAMIVLVIALANTWDKMKGLPKAPAVIFLYVIPALLMFFALSWSHVMTKIALIGSHLFLVERKVAAIVVGDGQFIPVDNEVAFAVPISWEHTLWSEASHPLIHRTVTLVLFGLSVLLTAQWILGATLLHRRFWMPGMPFDMTATFLVLGSLGTWTAAWMALRHSIKTQVRRALRNIRDYSKLTEALKPSVMR
jgi:hypothetical protein